ncbi:HAD family hydrolase [Aestuariivirga litoralis]|uniref:HAD family hydrolase n=1 Tax=Aestuariivirga litoralis TaxID=2650924 RepID=UPI0018C74237|nr:HAD family phosphatase [Aestuariivirga litoralis]MBG1233339.1 HAD family phosphatase [Aestuariivirga litoralis]
MNVVFDLGMVLIEWDPRHVYRQVFNDDAKMEWFLAEVCHGDWNLEQDRGRSFDDGVKEATARHPELAKEIALYRDRWMDMVPGDIPGSVAILKELHAKGTPLYAITNWNSDTYRATEKRFDFLKLFRDIVVSGDEKLIKPQPEIFQLLAARNGLNLADSLFIDDNLKNVHGAEAVGMRAHHFTGPESLRTDLQKRGIL